MTLSEASPYTFKNLRRQLGLNRRRSPRPMWQQRLSADSDFCHAVVGCGYLTREQMVRAAHRYRLGRSRTGGVIFWQIDMLDQIFDGKIMHYRPDCHRDKSRNPDWVSSALKRHYLHDAPRLAAGIASAHCLFGTHLLACREPRLPVAVVEAEKTAVILSEHYPQYLWLAAGGLNELSAVKLFPMRGHRILLFPDTDTDGKAYTTWYAVARKAEWLLGQPIAVSSLLERQATPGQKQRKIDLVDYLFEH